MRKTILLTNNLLLVMKSKNLIIIILAVLAVSFVSCSNNDVVYPPDCENGVDYPAPCECEDKEVFTNPYYVFVDSPFSTNREQCGHLLFLDLGSPDLYHGWFVWAKNLPKEYQIDILPVIVTYCVIVVYNESDCYFPVLNIIQIEKQ